MQLNEASGQVGGGDALGRGAGRFSRRDATAGHRRTLWSKGHTNVLLGGARASRRSVWRNVYGGTTRAKRSAMFGRLLVSNRPLFITLTYRAVL